MKIDILTLFPSMFTGPFDTSMLKKAQDNALVEIKIHDLRNWATDSHQTTDDRPYGGGKGMVLMIKPIDDALRELKIKNSKLKIPKEESRVVLLCPQGKVFTQAKARELAKLKQITLLAGHYEGFDERVREHLIDEEISIGNYVLTGGEIPAMAITDAIVRLIPGVLEEEATSRESFSDGATLDFPTYTRPAEYNGWKVPDILLTGDHKKIETWRNEQAELKTKSKKQ